MILSALVFFFGGVSTKFCDDLSHPDYTLLKEVINLIIIRHSLLSIVNVLTDYR